MSIISEKEKHKIGKMIKNNYSTAKTFRELQKYWYKISYYRTSRNYKLSKTIKQAKKLSLVVGASKNSASWLYSDTTKREKYLDPKNAKRTKRSNDYKGYASPYNADIFNSFNPELQLKDTESAIRNKLKDLLAESRDFKLMSALVLEFKK